MTDQRDGGSGWPVTRRVFLAGVAAAAFSGLTRAAADSRIQRRPIPSSGEALPTIGLGTSRTFDTGTSEAELAPRREVLRELVAAGGSVVDTSPMYGQAEAVVGRVAAETDLTDSLFLATKVWTTGREEGIVQMRESMALLGVETIDLMQVHNLVDWQVHLETLNEWKKEGLVRYTGITHYRSPGHEELARVMEQGRPDFVQLNYSILEREAEQRLLPMARDLGIAVLVNRPYARGQLFDRVRGKELPEWTAAWGCESWGQLFLKFILAHPAVTCIIPGTSKARHMRDNLGAARGPLPDAEGVKRIAGFFDSL